MKKRIQNGKRSKSTKSNETPSPDPMPPEPISEEHDEASSRPFPEGMVDHLRMAISLIEGREVSREEIQLMLQRILRQPPFDRERKSDYASRIEKEKPP